jgi:hypothetical protein
MASDAVEHSDFDDIFQYLVRVCNVRSAIALDEILQALRHDKLLADLHICGGARKERPSRQATTEELRAQAATGTSLDHLYDYAPPEGVTQRIHFHSWGRIFDLAIVNGRLIIIVLCALDYPWDACSFTVANRSVVSELWRAKAPLAPPAPAPAPAAPPRMLPTKKWLAAIEETHPQERGETAAAYARRLAQLQDKDPRPEHVLEPTTIVREQRRLREQERRRQEEERRLRERPKNPAGDPAKNRQKPGKPRRV